MKAARLLILICGISSVGWADQDSLRQTGAAADTALQTELQSTLQKALSRGDFASARYNLSQLSQAGVSSQQLQQLNRQLDLVSRSGALLHNSGLSNPFDPNEIDRALQMLAKAGNSEAVRELYRWLSGNGFEISHATEVKYLQHLLDAGLYEDAFRQVSQLEKSNNSATLQRLKARACDGIKLTDCVIGSLLPLWRQDGRVSDGRVLARNLLLQKRFQEAQPIVEALAKKSPGASWVQALQHQIDRATEQRIATLRRYYQKQPDEPHLRTLARALYNSGRHTEAIDTLTSYLRGKDAENETLLLLARYLSWQGKYKETISYLRQIDKPDASAKLLLAQSLHWAGEAKPAQKLLLELDATLPASEELWQTRLLLGYSFLQAGERSRALGYFEPLQKVDSKHLDRKALQRGLLEARQDYAGLIEQTRQTYNENPEDVSLALALANDYERSGNISDAIRYYEEFLQLKPEHSGARLNVGRLYLKDQRPIPGLRHLERYGYQLFTPESLTLLAKNYQWAARPRDAVRVAETMRFSFPDNTAVGEYHRLLTEKYSGFSRPVPEALLTDLIEADRHFYKHQYERAAVLYEVLLNRMPGDAEVLGRYRYSLGQISPVQGGGLRSATERYYMASNLASNHQYSNAILHLRALMLELPSKTALPAPLEHFTKDWVAAWQSQDFARYQRFYSQRYRDDASWISYKSRVFDRSEWINVLLLKPQLVEHIEEADNSSTYRLQFYQYYSTHSHSDVGLKKLEVNCQGAECQISDERWQASLLPFSGLNDLAAIAELDLLRLRQRALEVEEGDQVVEGVFLPSGVVKRPRDEEKVLATHYVEADQVKGSSGASGFVEQDRYAMMPALPEPRSNQAGLGYRYFSDSDDVRYREPALRGQYEYGPYELSFRLARFNFDSPLCGAETGGTVELSLNHNDLAGGVYIDQLNSNQRVFPHLSKKFRQDNRTTTLGYRSRSLFFDKLSCRSLQKEIRRHTVSFDQYHTLRDGQALWYGLELGYISDGNRDLTGQFDYVFSQSRGDYYRYELAAGGWYLWNQDQSADYYSPESYDSTRLRARGYALPAGYWQFIADLSLGYTFEDAKKLYSWGLWLQHPFDREGLVKFGCGRNNSSGSNLGQQSYTSTDCRAELEYYWQ